MEPEDAGVDLDVGELDEVLEAPDQVQHPPSTGLRPGAPLHPLRSTTTGFWLKVNKRFREAEKRYSINGRAIKALPLPLLKLNGHLNFTRATNKKIKKSFMAGPYPAPVLMARPRRKEPFFAASHSKTGNFKVNINIFLFFCSFIATYR